MSNPVEVSQEVRSALNRNQPIVALESSLIANGLPKKINVETAQKMEDAVKSKGAFPATCGIIGGQIKVGLDNEDIALLGKQDAMKVTARDIPYTCVKKLDGGTTVSATSRIASVSGISVLATGGIGGVHRGFSETVDISNDLWELAHNPLIVVCSGAKAILNIPATFELLETWGVQVYGYQTDELPSFYSRSCGIKVPAIADAKEFAELVALSRNAVGSRSAIVLAVPIPEKYELNANREIEEAAHQAANEGIRGKELTPYLLDKLADLTGGKSVESNIELLTNNATVAAEVACALHSEDKRRIGFLG